MGKIEAICISRKRGVQKEPIKEANLLVHWGIEGDAHGGKWHRQVSLLSADKIKAFRFRFCYFTGRHLVALRGRASGNDANRQGMSYSLRHLSFRRRLYYAARRRICPCS